MTKRRKSYSQFKILAQEIKKNISLFPNESIDTVAKHVGVSRATFYRYLADMSGCPLGILIKTMDYLQIPSLTLEPRY